MEDDCHSATFIMSLTRIWLIIVVQSPELADVPYSHYLRGSLSYIIKPMVIRSMTHGMRPPDTIRPCLHITTFISPLTGGINPLPHAF